MDQLRIMLDQLDDADRVPYAALAYLAGECNYGGRVTDDKDRRCLVNVLSDFYCADIVEDDGYRFSPSGTYYAPRHGGLFAYKEFVRELPYSEGPEVFGLHDNANISCAIAETNALLGTALSLQPRAAAGAGKSYEQVVGELALDIEARLPAQFDIEKALIDFPVKYEESMNTVLTQELLRFNRLTDVMKESLYEIQRAIKGLVVMSGELEAMGTSMTIGKVPAMWTRFAYPSLKGCGPWVSDLLQRLEFLGSWNNAGVAPNIFWISGFFFTQAFITGTLQNFARKYQVPIDTVDFDYAVLKPHEHKEAEDTKAPDGAVTWGLFMEGARFDREQHCVSESNPRELFTTMPYILLLPRIKKDIEAVKGLKELYTGSFDGTAHVYMCPVYKTSIRFGVLSTTGHSTNFVMYVRLPMAPADTQEHWTKRGVACLTGLDD
jgi:dynein heavy chain